jgi:hypothetical protein
MTALSSTYRPNLSRYWRDRLFIRKCTHFDVFLYEIPAEYSRKYTHLIHLQYREAGSRVTKEIGYVCMAYSFAGPVQVRTLPDYLERADTSDPLRITSRVALGRPKGKALAEWFSAYHHRHFLPLTAKLADLERERLGARGRVSVRFHYFAPVDLNPARGFANLYASHGKGRRAPVL